MAEPIREALFRIHNSDAAGIAHEEIYGYSVEKDLLILGRAYLAEHPADSDEPITFDEVADALADDEDGIPFVASSGGKTFVSFDDLEVKTRGQLRHLMAALGINIPIEPKGGGK